MHKIIVYDSIIHGSKFQTKKKEKNKLIDIILRLQLNYSNNEKKTDKQTYP